MSEPDLFVVCKNCSSEVSPYVTECPYCGQRVRKRAPKIDRGEPEEPRRRSFSSALPRLRSGEIPGIAAETRPWATIALVAVAGIVTLVGSAGASVVAELGLQLPLEGDAWRLFTTPFYHGANIGYAFVAMLATGIFGMHLERRFGPVAVVSVFLLSGVAGAALALVTDLLPALGANGAALGLLSAWLVDDRRAAARGDDRGSDLIGVWVIAAVLFGLTLATVRVGGPEASIAAAVGGSVAGSLCGLVLSTLRR